MFKVAKKNTPLIVLFLINMFQNFIFNASLNQSLFVVPAQAFSTAGMAFLFLAIAYLLKGRIRFCYLLVYSVFLALFWLANICYFRYYYEPISFYTFGQISNLNNLGPSILAGLKITDLIFVVHLAVLFIGKKRIQFIPRNILLFCLIFIIGISAYAVKPFKNLVLDKASLQYTFTTFERGDFLATWAPPGYLIKDLIDFTNTNKVRDLSEEELETITEWFKKKKEIQAAHEVAAKVPPLGSGHNLLLIQVESLQNFVIDARINGYEITPNLNRIINEGIYYKNIYPQTRSGRSSDAELLVNTGLYPVKNGSTFFRFPANQYKSLPDVLKQKGYTTIAIHGDESGFWNRNKAYPNLGFQHYFGIENLEADDLVGMGLSDKSMFRQSVDILKDTAKPFYAHIITLTSHGPFKLPDRLKNLDLELGDLANANKELANYLYSINYVDHAIGEFMQELTQNNLLQNTLVVIYGDHEGISGSGPGSEVFKINQTVPFIIYYPGIQGFTSSQIGGQVDIYPTLAYLLGFEEEVASFVLGKNLLTTNLSFAVRPVGSKFISSEKNESVIKEHALQGIEISDWLLESNYFVRYLN